MPSVQRAARTVPSRVPVKLRLLPCQRPASPELKLSPSATIAVVDDVGPAFAAGAKQSTQATAAQTAMASFDLPIPLPLFGCRCGPGPAERRTYPTARIALKGVGQIDDWRTMGGPCPSSAS